MVIKYLKVFNNFATRELQIKTSLRFYLTPVRGIIKKTKTKAAENVEEETLLYCWGT